MKNQFIKAANVQMEYTPEMILEIKKCYEDPIYFVEHYMKVQHPAKGAIAFIPYEYQRRCIKAFQENRWSIVLARPPAW